MKGHGPPPESKDPPEPEAPAHQDLSLEARLEAGAALAERKFREHEAKRQRLEAKVKRSDDAWWAWWRAHEAGAGARLALALLLIILAILLLR